MKLSWHIITNSSQFRELTKSWNDMIACDTETYGKSWEKDARLLGISLAPTDKHEAIYVPVNHFIEGRWERVIDEELLRELSRVLSTRKLIGHNFTYDKRWLLSEGIATTWHADTRLMWHMSSAPSGSRGYSLKDAQVELLGWEHSNEHELEQNVKAKGGKLKDGEHYMADVDLLGKYACLDAYATSQCYAKLAPFFDQHAYWPLLCDIMAYNELLDLNHTLGVKTDKEGLKSALNRLNQVCNGAKRRFFKPLQPVIEELEQDWADRKIAGYKREFNRVNYLNSPYKWKRFNLNSDSDKRELFYGKLQLPILETTEGGKPSTSSDALKQLPLPNKEEYLKYEKANTLISNFAQPYIDSVGSDNRIHPGFNICGTVSYRLSGFKPYLLNAPFDEKIIMKHLQCDEGFVGLHADLWAIEPAITASLSEDPALLKVFRDGLGDIYLDLALDLFPNDKELQSGYNPHVRVLADVKKRFEKQRKIAKVIQLAVQYTGTGHTVSRNLTKEGIPTSLHQAEHYVRQYWRKFRKVAEFNARLKEVNRAQGYLRNVIGRIIRVPNPDYKDLSNRFIQSSAHDVLILWILEIYRQAAQQGVEIKPILLDCHDSTSNQVRHDKVEHAKVIYKDALRAVNDRLDLGVEIKMEMKTFKSLAGLKGEE